MNKKMMILGGLLLAVVVTGYSVSGAYAKYVQSAEVSDEARVAQFKVEKNGDTFEIFNTKLGEGVGAEAIIAPGYSNFRTLTFTDMATLKSEVPTNIRFTIDDSSQSISYDYLSTPDDVEDDYKPIKFAIVEVPADKTAEEIEIGADAWKSLEDLKAYLTSNVLDANKNYKVAWQWELKTDDETNEKDTALGNAIADAIKTSNNDKKGELTVKLVIKATVEQNTETGLNSAIQPAA